MAYNQGKVNADVTNVADLERVFKKTSDKFGKIDVIVANAGGGTIETVATIGEADYDKTMDLNLKSVYFTVHKALPYMNDGGSIILIGSNAAHQAYASFTLYGAAKAAVLFSKGIFKRPFRQKDQGKCNNTGYNGYTGI